MNTYEIICQTCGNPFEAVHAYAKSCSDACRSKARHERYRRERTYATGTLRRLVAVLAPLDEILADNVAPGDYAELRDLLDYSKRLLATLP